MSKTYHWTYRERRAAWSRVRRSLASRGALRRISGPVRDAYMADLESLTKGDLKRLARWFPVGSVPPAARHEIDRAVAGGCA